MLKGAIAFPAAGYGRRFPAILSLVLLLVHPGLESAEPEVRISVLVSQDAGPYLEALAGFKDTLEKQRVNAVYDIHPLHGKADLAGPELEQAIQTRPRLVFTLGSMASQAAVKQIPEIPLVAGMILNAEDLDQAPNATSVVLEFPAEMELRWLARLLPKEKRIGVLFNSPDNQGRLEEAARVAREMGLTLELRRLESPRDLPAALDSLAAQADVLWGIPDPMVLYPQTAQPILLFSLRTRIPFVGPSLTWVKAGAQCGEKAIQILSGAPARSLPPAAPRKAIYSVNLKTARQLKVEIPRDLPAGAQSVVE